MSYFLDADYRQMSFVLEAAISEALDIIKNYKESKNDKEIYSVTYAIANIEYVLKEGIKESEDIFYYSAECSEYLLENRELLDKIKRGED